MRRAASLRFLDLSENPIDKKGADGLASALLFRHTGSEANNTSTSQASSNPGVRDRYSIHSEDDEDMPPCWTAPLLAQREELLPRCTIASLRLEACSLKNSTLETLAVIVRNSSVKHISLRRNRINNIGAVALAVMIRDYELPQNHNPQLAAHDLFTPAQNSDMSHLESQTPSSALSTVHGTDSLPVQAGHFSSHQAYPQQFYNTQHAPRNSVTAKWRTTSPQEPRRQHSTTPTLPPVDDIKAPDTPVDQSHIGSDDEEAAEVFGPDRNRGRFALATTRDSLRHSEMKTRITKQIAALPLVGSLLTLDVRSNDIRVSLNPLPILTD